MARIRALDLVKPFTVLMPEVQKPYSKVDEYERLVFTICGGILFVVMSEMPLHGVVNSIGAPDAVGNLRYVVGSSNGTLLDIGPSVIFFSGFLLQILAGLKWLNVSLDTRGDRTLFQSAQKLLAIALTVLLATLSVFSGTYGAPSFIGTTGCIFLILQLVLGNVALILIDEVLTKGYGVGTGLLLFSSIKCAQKFTWDMLSMLTVQTPRGQQTVGVLPSLFFGVNSRSVKYTLKDSAFRQDLPNATSLLVAVVAFFSFVWLSTLRYETQITSTRARSQQQGFPIRILYTNAQPLLFLASFLSIFYQLSAYIVAIAPENPWLRFLATYETTVGQQQAVSGLVYYLSAPTNWDPVRFLSYFVFVTITSGVFSRLWTQSSGFGPNDLARSFKEQSIVFVGRRDTSLVRELRRLIYPISLLGGLILGASAALFDIAAGWGFVMGVGVLNMLNVYEILGNENISPDALMGAPSF